jgi:hypothetical protein
MKFTWKILIISLVFVSFLTGTKLAYAQTANQVILTAIPPRLGEDFKLKAKPGEKIQTIIRVRNNSEEEITINSSAEDFIVDENGETPLPVKDQVSGRWSLATWMTISPQEQTIQPGKTANVNVVIDVPADALPGGHYAMVLHQPLPNGALETGAKSAIGQRVGTLVYFLVDGPINEQAFVRDFTIPSFTEYGPVPFSFLVENVSDVHIQPQIGVEIYNIFGQKVQTISMDTKNVFPFVPRKFEGSWGRIWGIGPYTAKVVMSYGTHGEVSIVQKMFWLLPIKIVLAVLLFVFAIAAIIVVFRKQVVEKRNVAQKKINLLEKKLEELEKHN